MVKSPNPDEECRDCSKGKPRIILVEDYDDNRELMTKLLDPVAEIVACKNSTAALHYFLDAFRCQPHSGMLLDAALPDINGLRTMAAIRELERGSTAECVPIRLGLVSGNTALVADTPAFNRLGVTLALLKPVDPVSFVPKVVEWLREPAPPMYLLTPPC